MIVGSDARRGASIIVPARRSSHAPAPRALRLAVAMGDARARSLGAARAEARGCAGGAGPARPRDGARPARVPTAALGPVALVEADRLRFAAERGFSVYASQMHPVSCTPKRDVLVGAPAGGEAARELEEGLHADAENPARALFLQEGE